MTEVARVVALQGAVDKPMHHGAGNQRMVATNRDKYVHRAQARYI